MESTEKKRRSAYEMAELFYRHQQLSLDLAKMPIDYGTGELYTSAEVHIVTRIEENPGITVTQIADATLRTKSAVSQMVTKLESKGLLQRKQDPKNAKQTLLFVTPKGLELSKTHKAYDEKMLPLDDLTALFGQDALDVFQKILEYMTEHSTKLLQERLDKK